MSRSAARRRPEPGPSSARNAAGLACALALSGLLGSGAARLGAATWEVTSLDDTTQPGTLRAAVASAAAGDTIAFSPSLFPDAAPKTITLSSPLVVSKNLSILSPGDVAGPNGPVAAVQLAGDPTSPGRLLEVRCQATLLMSGIGFQGGLACAPGGGAVLVDSGARATFQGCDFEDNEATGCLIGGALLNQGTLTLDQCLLAQNSAASGGAVANLGTLQIVRSLLLANKASGPGGGVYGAGSLWIESSTLSGNAAGSGGALAVCVRDEGCAAAYLNAVTVMDNTAAGGSGGVYAEGAGASVNIAGSIVFRNSVTCRGGTAPLDLGTGQRGRITSGNYNLFGAPGGVLSPCRGNDQIGVDPLAGPLAYNGGRTETYAVGIASPAVNKGDPNFAGLLVGTDQRGFARVWPAPPAGRADIGAYEFFATLSLSAPPTVEAQGPTTPVTVTAGLNLPLGGAVTALWTVGGSGQPAQSLTVPNGGATFPIAFQGAFPLGSTPVSLLVSAPNLSLSASTAVTVVDTTPPALTLPANQILEATGPSGAVATFSGSAVDLVSGTVPVTFSPPSGSTFALGTTVVTATAKDGAGNTATGFFDITVRDTTPPVVTPPAPIVVEATGPSGAAVTFAATAVDLVSGNLPVAFSPLSGSTFALGTTLVTATAVDGAGNVGSATFTVTVRDTTPPVITPPAPIVAEATGPAGAVVTFSATAFDLVSGSVPVVASPASGSTFPLGTTVVTCKAVDGAGNIATTTFPVTVRDTTPPVLTLPANITAQATVTAGGVVTYAATALDLVSGSVPVTLSPVSGSTFPVGTTTVTATATDAAGNVATGTFTVTITDPYGITLPNVAWPLAIDFTPSLVTSGIQSQGTVQQIIVQPGESRWYKFYGPPGSQVQVTLTNQPVNFDLVIYSDINQAYNTLLSLTEASSSSADKTLALLGTSFSPEAYSPEAYSPEAYSPEAYSPEAYSPEAYSPEAYSPAVYSPEAFSPEAYSPEAYSPEAYSPEAYSPEAYSPEAYSPGAYASAQNNSLVGFSANPGTESEGVSFNTFAANGEFYVRIRGQNGVYSATQPFTLTVTIQNLAAALTNLSTVPASTPPSGLGSPTSLILWDSVRTPGTSADVAALAASLASFAKAANAVVVDLNTDSQIAALYAQADANPNTPAAENLVANTVRNLILLYRNAAPSLQDITLIGSDAAIPFFRSNDNALLANEDGYFPPVLDNTPSQASLRSGLVLSQDRYGSSSQVILSTGPYDLPGLPVGRVVETAAQAKAYLDMYAALFNGTPTSGTLPTPTSAMVAGYDFMATSAVAVGADLSAAMGAGSKLDSLISPISQAPALGWTADQFRALFLGTRHDITYVGAHFSTGGALAADFSSVILASDVASSAVNLKYALVMSAGCHSGYNTVNQAAVPLLSALPDWAQAFSQKGALLIGGTGYQYGDTDFIAYTDLLALDTSEALHTGTGAVSVGQALVQAKLKFLANTADFRGIHEKTLLEFVLYGLPMVKFNFAGARISSPTQALAVTSTTPVASGPGLAQGLREGDLLFDPVLTRVDTTLTEPGSAATVVASYFSGPSGTVTLPSEPVRPLASFNVSRPADGYVRGTGFRGATYHDVTGWIPFTGAPATEVRGVHSGFSTSVYYPIQTANLNQIGALSGGISVLNAFPDQFLSDTASSQTGTLRAYDQMDYTVFYCPTVSPAALSNPPAVNVVSSALSGSVLTFSVDVAATASSGVQEVWVTYTGQAGSPFHGVWQSLTLSPPSGAGGIGTWTGSLTLPPGTDPSQMRYMVQAANGFGAVTLDTNFGSYFIPNGSTLAGIGAVTTPTTLALVGTVPASAPYGGSVPVTVALTGMSGQPLAGESVQFQLGAVSETVVTDANGHAAATLALTSPPGAYTLRESFAGDANNQASAASQPFTIVQEATSLVFPGPAIVTDPSQITVRLVAADATPLSARSVVFLLTGGGTKTAYASTTDNTGLARLTGAAVLPGTYQVTAVFGEPVTLPDGSVVSLSDTLYLGSSATSGVTVAAALTLSNDQALVVYDDKTAPGAKPGDLGASSVDLQGSLRGAAPKFSLSSIVASRHASTVSAYVSLELSGSTLWAGTLPLHAYGACDDRHWQGWASLAGSTLQISVDWDDSAGRGIYHAAVCIARGTGPLYAVTPALLQCELILGTGTGEHPAGGTTTIGGTAEPWTQQTGFARIRACR